MAQPPLTQSQGPSLPSMDNLANMRDTQGSQFSPAPLRSRAPAIERPIVAQAPPHLTPTEGTSGNGNRLASIQDQHLQSTLGIPSMTENTFHQFSYDSPETGDQRASGASQRSEILAMENTNISRPAANQHRRLVCSGDRPPMAPVRRPALRTTSNRGRGRRSGSQRRSAAQIHAQNQPAVPTGVRNVDLSCAT